MITFSLNLIASSLVPGNTSSPTAATSVGVGVHLYVNMYVNVYMYMNMHVHVNVDMDADMDVHVGIYQILIWTMMETSNALTYLIAFLVVDILAGHHSNASLGSVEPASQKSGPRRQKPSQPLGICLVRP